jgi:hypothetical protein
LSLFESESLFLFKKSLLKLAVLTLMIFSCATTADASKRLLIQFKDLKGIKSVSVVLYHGPNSYGIVDARFYNKIENTINNTIQEIFSKQSVVRRTVKEDTPADILFLIFTLSAREEKSDGKWIKVGDLSLQLKNYSGPLSPLIQPTYPFVIPDTQQELDSKISAGIHYLTDFLPNYIVCAQQDAPCNLSLDYSYPDAPR